MSRVLLAWELGAGFGHLVTLRALARLLRAQGRDCVFAVRHLGSANEFLEQDLGPVLQAPARLGPGRNPVKTQVSYASLLHNVGFDDRRELAGRIAAWRALMQELDVGAVFADHGPIALVAARTLGLPACYVGSGFTVPPLLTPFPSFRPRMNVPEKVLTHNEAEVLKELNSALELLKLPPFASLGDIFRGARPALLSYEPLDAYETSRPEPFLGLPDFSHGEAPSWPDGDGPRLFAYLRPFPGLPVLLEELKKSRARVLLRMSGAPLGVVKPYLRPGMTAVDKAVNFRQAAESCDGFVNYGAHSTVCEFLLAGKPGLVVPMHHEQVLTSRRAVALGACVGVRGKEAKPYADALTRLLEDDSLRKAAAGFAERCRGVKRDAILPGLIAATS